MNDLSASSRRTAVGDAILCAKGFCIGVANLIPGVSGGTMALVLGIYSRFIHAIRSFDWTAVRLLAERRFSLFFSRVQWRFLLTVGVGIVLSVFSMSMVIKWLLDHRPVLVMSFFFGLIMASVFSVGKDVGCWKWDRLLSFSAGSAGAYLVAGMVPVNTPEGFVFLFVCGALAACAMILPGISGAFILVLLGKYHFLLDAINRQDLAVLGVVAAGAVAGLVLFARFLGWLLDRYYSLVLASLTGVMLGSLRKLWPWKGHAPDAPAALLPVNTLPPAWDMETVSAFLLMLAGIAAVAGLGAMAGVRK